MTPQEYEQLTTWFLDGKAEYRRHPCRDWEELRSLEGFRFISPSNFNSYRRCPDTKPLPDEVWIDPVPEDPFKWWVARIHSYNEGAIRYVRADAVIDGERLEFRTKLAACASPDSSWTTLNNCEIRFKP